MDKNLFQSLCKMPNKSLYSFLMKIFEKSYSEIHYVPDKYIYAVGNLPITLVAHADTVFTIKPLEFFYDEEKDIMWSPEGLGADDRAGIYAILTLLAKGFKPSVIITDGEEKGGIGAKKFIEDFPRPRAKTNYVIEIDRQGKDDCVFYSCDNPKFEKYIESFGFITQWGTFTDISIICPAWGVAGVNLSAGYLDEHSYAERLCPSWLDMTINKVAKILSQKTHKKYKYIPKKNYYRTLSSTGILTECDACNDLLCPEDYLVIYDESGIGRKLCWNCIEKYSSALLWCDNCHSLYMGDKCGRCSK